MNKFIKIIIILSAVLIAVPALASDDDVLRLIVMHTNDVHGHITPREATWMNPDFPPEVGGHASMRRYVNEVRERAKEEGSPLLLLDSGDIFQGTPVGGHDKGETVVKFMNEMGYDAMTLGNHDFDEGEKYAKLVAENANFPVLAANIVDEETGEVVDYVEPYLIKEFDGIKVGIIGVTTVDTKTLTPEEATEGLTFLPTDDTMRKYVDILRNEKDVDIIIGLVHIGVTWDTEKYRAAVEKSVQDQGDFSKDFGLNAVEVAALVPGIDVMVGGHVHYGLRTPYEDPVTHTVIFQTYGLGSGIGQAELLIDKKSGNMIGYEYDTEGEEVTIQREEYWPIREVEERIELARSKAEEGMNEIIGETTVPLLRGDYENLMGNVVTDGMRYVTGADVALINRGGLRANIYTGEITVRDVKQVLPFYDMVVTFDVDGETLMKILEASVSGRRRDTNLSGVKIVFDFGKPSGNRILEATINGKSIDPDKKYTFATSSYLAEGSIGYDILADLEGRYTEYSLSDVMLKYVQEQSPLSPQIEGRIKRINTKKEE